MRPFHTLSLVFLGAVNTLWLGGCERTTEIDPFPEVQIAAISSTSLTGTVGAEVQPAPAVRVTDEQDRPLAGVAVTFKVVSGGGGVSGGTVTTADDGSASVQTWTLGSTAGTQTLAATTGGEAEVVFTALATAGPMAQLTAASGNNQLTGVGKALEQPLVVVAADAFGNPVAGIQVEFAVTSGGGSIAAGAVVTDATGTAEGQWTLGVEAGVQHVTAASGGARAVFRAFAAAPPGELEGQIAFVSWDDPFLDIAVVNPDGSGRSKLAPDSYGQMPAWSPDGSLIAFARLAQFDPELDYPTWRMGIMTANGANVSWLVDGYAFFPAWSPDGAAIAISGISVVSVTDGTVTPLFMESDGGGQPSWSPDGRKLAFIRSNNGVFDIYTANADGSDVTALTHGYVGSGEPVRSYSHPAWSPDGTMIAFVYGLSLFGQDFALSIAVMSADGVFLKNLASAGSMPRAETPDPGSLAWSPDGTGIAYSFRCFNASPDPCSDTWNSIKYVSLDGSRQFTIADDAQSPTWRR